MQRIFKRNIISCKSKVQPIISRAYVSSLRSATTQISGEETIRLLYPDLKTISSKQQKSYTIWQKWVHRDVIEQVLRNSELLRNSDNPKKEKKEIIIYIIIKRRCTLAIICILVYTTKSNYIK